MNGNNALQVGAPDTSDNPLAQVPTSSDAYGISAPGGVVSSGVDPLTQWLAQQRAKNQSQQMGLWAGGMFPTDLGYMGPGTSRVEPEKIYDVQPILDMGNVDITQPSTRPLSNQEQQWWGMLDALRRTGASQATIDYHMSQNPQVIISDRWQKEGQQSPQDADAMMRAVTARQKQLRK